MAYLKQDEVKRSKAKKGTDKKRDAGTKPEPVKVVVSGPEAPGYNHSGSIQHDINYVSGLSGLIDIRDSLDWIAKGLMRLTSDGHNVHLTTGYGTDPVRLTLAEDDYGDGMGRFLSAFERIADSLARLAGLSRPRLEQWYEQAEYEPRYKDIACDGGTPGPAEVKSASA